MSKIDIEWLLRLVDALPPDDRTAVQLRHGLDGNEHSLSEIGRILKITKERARQKLARAHELILMAIDDPEFHDRDLSFLLAAARLRKLAGSPPEPPKP